MIAQYNPSRPLLPLQDGGSVDGQAPGQPLVGSYTWAHDFPGAYPNDPNGVFDQDTSRWDVKVSGSYEAPLKSGFLRSCGTSCPVRRFCVGSRVC